MDFFENRHKNKKQKRNPTSDFDMPLFGQTSDRFLSAPVALVRRRADTVVRPRDDVDEFLSSDLEISFASTVSLNSPPKDPIALTPEHEYAEPMDISPAPLLKPSMPRGRPRAFTSGARLFGNDMSNCLNSAPVLQPSPSIRGGSNSAKRIQRSALPTEWFTTRTEVLTIVLLISYFQGDIYFRRFLNLPRQMTMQWTLIRPPSILNHHLPPTHSLKLWHLLPLQ